MSLAPVAVLLVGVWADTMPARAVAAAQYENNMLADQ